MELIDSRSYNRTEPNITAFYNIITILRKNTNINKWIGFWRKPFKRIHHKCCVEIYPSKKWREYCSKDLGIDIVRHDVTMYDRKYEYWHHDHDHSGGCGTPTPGSLEVTSQKAEYNSGR